MIAPQQIVDTARTFVGVPFRHQGRSRLGLDCVGLVLVVLEELGAAPPVRLARNYSRMPHAQLERALAKWCAPAPAAGPGVVLSMLFPHQSHPAHIAICTGENIIHANAMTRFVVEHGYREPWISRTVSAWQLPGVAYE